MAGPLMVLGVVLVVVGFIIGIAVAVDWSAQTPANVLLFPLFVICIGVGMAFAGDRVAKEGNDKWDAGSEKVPARAGLIFPFLWLIGALVIADVGHDGISRLPSPVPWRDPETWSLVAYGLGSVFLLAYCLQVTLRLRRAGNAVTGTANRVVLSRDRLASVLLAVGMALVEPEFVISGWMQGGKAWGAAFAAPCLIFLTLQKLKTSTPTVIDDAGIECPGQWVGRIRWQDLDDIRLDSIRSARGSLVPSLTFWFREGVPVPRRTYPQKNLDIHLGLGGFMVMTAPLGLSLSAALTGFKMRLARYRAAHPDEPIPAPSLSKSPP